MKPYKQIWQAIAEDIKEDIVSGRYKPEQRLREADLADKYSVSKSPVREALRHLEGIGFVEIIPHTMAYVKKMDKKEVRDLYSIESVLEGLAAREAIPNMNSRDYERMDRYATLLEDYYNENNHSGYEKANISFHSVIWEASNNGSLIKLVNNIRERLQRFRTITRLYPDKFKDLVYDHREILNAAVQKNSEKTERLVRRHFEKNAEIIVSLLENENDLLFEPLNTAIADVKN
jgi:DNA-binding GntR family transcriptional regulator